MSASDRDLDTGRRPTLGPARARELAARSASRRRRLTLEDVEAAFAVPLDTLAAAMARLDRISVWACAGLLAGSVAGAAVRAIEVWVKANADKATREDMEAIVSELDRVKADLAATKGAPRLEVRRS